MKKYKVSSQMRATTISLWLAGVAGMIWQAHCIAVRSHFPDHDLGYIYEVQNHGNSVYVSWSDHVIVTWGTLMPFALFAALVAWQIFWQSMKE